MGMSDTRASHRFVHPAALVKEGSEPTCGDAAFDQARLKKPPLHSAQTGRWPLLIHAALRTFIADIRRNSKKRLFANLQFAGKAAIQHDACADRIRPEAV